MMLTNLCEGLLIINAKPTIALLKCYVTAGLEALMILSLAPLLVVAASAAIWFALSHFVKRA